MPDKNKQSSNDPTAGIIILGITFGLIIILNLFFSGDKDEQDTSLPKQSPKIEEQSTLKYDEEKEVEKSSDNLIKVYATEMAELSKKVGDSQEALGEFLIENPNILTWSDQDAMHVAIETTMIELYYEQAEEIIPPSGLKETHDLFLLAMEKYAKAMPIFRQGVDEINPDKVSLSTDLMEEGGILMWQATNQLEIDAEALGY